MKQTLYYYTLCLLLVLGTLTSCGEDDNTAAPAAAQISITVKDATGTIVPGMNVYMFLDPASKAEGRNPAKALKVVSTNTSGISSFDLKQFPALGKEGTLYFTVLEGTPFDAKGTVSVSYKEGETIEKELLLQGNSPTPTPTPTPGNSSYAYGYLPTTVTHELAMSEYERWKSTQVVACGDGLRVIAAPANETKVEGIGFGLLLAAYAGDKETFDGILRFYNSKRTPEAKNMMAWSVTCSGTLDPGSATDGDIDVAFALIVASKHWGDSYLNAAKEIIQLVRTNLIVQCTVGGKSIYILAPGYSGRAWGGCGMTDLMYHTPAFFRVFATVTGDNVWAQLADDTYTLLEAGANPTTGLVPDWQTATGTPGPEGRIGYFGYDAARAPWRLTLDYLWNGNAKADAWADKVSGWAETVGPANIVDGYELNGKPRGTNGLNSAFLGGFAVAATSHSQARADKFGAELSKLRDTYWFNINTRVLYLFTLTGNFYDPLKK
ncbi:glycosyl hydrolase family 8 [Pontibacter rugosus]|uniref:cellulase n=1 Tax=Pontibacter rugosus TaxID=1745966 RepID=A0ABW3SLF8_9BACT